MSGYNRFAGRRAAQQQEDDLPSYIYRPQASASMSQGRRAPEPVAASAAAPRIPRPSRPREPIQDEEAGHMVEDASTRDSAFTKKRGRFQYSPPTARKATGVTFDGSRDDNARMHRPPPPRERPIAAGEAISSVVPKLSEDRVDKSVHWKDVHGIKIEEIAVLDKAVRARRFKPGEDIVDRVEYTLQTCCNEQNFSTQQMAVHLYKGGIKSIWLRGRGSYFYGTEQAYIETMKGSLMRPSIDTKTLNVFLIFENLPDNDHPDPVAAEKAAAAASARAN